MTAVPTDQGTAAGPERTSSRPLSALGKLPHSGRGEIDRLLWLVALAAGAIGLVAFATDTLQGGVIALWAFVVMGVAVALVLPLPYALVSPLFAGAAGWLVDMLPLLILAGWTTVALRWLWSLVAERRWPRGGRWVLLPVFLFVWTAVGITVITSLDFRHFVLLLGIQFVISAVLLAVVDSVPALSQRTQVASGLVAFIILLSAAVLLQWLGINIQGLQDTEVRRRVEAAYGLDAFPNAIGMIKYARSKNAGALELTRDLKELKSSEPDLPPFSVFRPKFRAYENNLIVRFRGSARSHEAVLKEAGVELAYDNIGLAPANTVPRMRSLPRNALTYAGAAAAVLPFAFFLMWTGAGRRRLLGRLGVAACLFGVAFSLARGAWAAVLIGFVYLWLDGKVSSRLKLEYIAAFMLTAVVMTGVFFSLYRVDPLTGRAGGGASVSTRAELYSDTLGFLKSKHLFLGYGTAQPRTESGTVREGEGRRYVPRAGTHSTYLNYLFRTGLPGAIVIFALYLFAGLHARTAARVRDGHERIFATMAATSVAIAGAHGVILSLYVEPTYTLVVALVLALAMAGNDRLGRSILPWKTGHE